MLVAAGAWAYANSLDGPFVFDDVPGILRNPSIQSLWPPSQWLAAPPGSTPSGRPVLNLSLALNYAVGGLGVRGYHLLNVAVHLAAALALFGVVRRTLLSDRMRERYGSFATPAAFASALLWVLHPLNTESVTYVIQRGEALAGLFQLLTLYCAIRGHTIAAVVACALGMGSKETAIVAPLLVLLWDYAFHPRGAIRWRFYGVLALTIFVVLMPMRAETQGRTAVAVALSGTGEWTPLTYLWTQAGVIVHYLKLVFWPAPLVFDYYGWPRATSAMDVLPQVILLCALLAASMYGLWKRHPAGYAGMWFFLTLGPTSSLLPVPTEIAAEHRMYLALAAPVSITAVAFLILALKVTQPSAKALHAIGEYIVVAPVLVCIGLGALTYSRNDDYGSDETLWRDTVQKRPTNARARLNYAIDLMQAGRAADAEAQMRQAMTLDMDNGTRAQALLQLGAAQAAQGRIEAGVAAIEQGLHIDPSLTDADAILGQAYADQGKDALAAKFLLRAAENKNQKQRELILQRAAWVLATSRDPAVRDGTRAVTLIQEAIAMTGGREALHFETLAAACAELGRVADAIAAMDHAISLTQARGDSQTTTLYERQRAFYAAGGRVAIAR